MANKKISQLTGTNFAQLLDLFPIARSGANYQLNFEQLKYSGFNRLGFAGKVSAGTLIPMHWYSVNSCGDNATLDYFIQATTYTDWNRHALMKFDTEWVDVHLSEPENDPFNIITRTGNVLSGCYPYADTGSDPNTGTNFPIETRYNIARNYVQSQISTQLSHKADVALVADNTFKGSNSIDGRLLTMVESKIYGVTLTHTSAPTGSITIQNCDLSNVTIISDGSDWTLNGVTAKNCTLYLDNAVQVYQCTILANNDQLQPAVYHFDGSLQSQAVDSWAGLIYASTDEGTSTVRLRLDLSTCYDSVSQILTLPPDTPAGIIEFTDDVAAVAPCTVATVSGGNIMHQTTLKWAPNSNPGSNTISFNFASNPATAGPEEILQYNQHPSSLDSLIYEGDHIHIQRESNGFQFWLLKGGNHYH